MANRYLSRSRCLFVSFAEENEGGRGQSVRVSWVRVCINMLSCQETLGETGDDGWGDDEEEEENAEDKETKHKQVKGAHSQQIEEEWGSDDEDDGRSKRTKSHDRKPTKHAKTAGKDEDEDEDEDKAIERERETQNTETSMKLAMLAHEQRNEIKLLLKFLWPIARWNKYAFGGFSFHVAVLLCMSFFSSVFVFAPARARARARTHRHAFVVSRVFDLYVMAAVLTAIRAPFSILVARTPRLSAQGRQAVFGCLLEVLQHQLTWQCVPMQPEKDVAAIGMN